MPSSSSQDSVPLSTETASRESGGSGSWLFPSDGSLGTPSKEYYPDRDTPDYSTGLVSDSPGLQSSSEFAALLGYSQHVAKPPS